MSETLSIELEDEVRRALDRLVQKTARSVDDIVNRAVRDYLDVQEWQQRKIEAGIAAADRGEFAAEDELARIAQNTPSGDEGRLGGAGRPRSRRHRRLYCPSESERCTTLKPGLRPVAWPEPAPAVMEPFRTGRRGRFWQGLARVWRRR